MLENSVAESEQRHTAVIEGEADGLKNLLIFLPALQCHAVRSAQVAHS